MEEGAELESHLVESLNSVKTIKQFGMETYFNSGTDQKFSHLLKTIYSSVLNGLFSATSSEFLSRLFTIILLWAGSYYVIDRTITPGELLSFYALIGYLTGPVSQLIGMNKTLQNALIAADRLFEIMDLEREENQGKLDLPSSQVGDIVFENIRFSYGSRIEVFKDFSCRFEKGKMTAIIGESGSGKTTLGALIQQLYPVQSGKIHIGQYDLQYISKQSLRERIAVVPQQIDLFSGNVIDNIAVGEQVPNFQRMMEVVKQLDMMSFIEKLPSGFETYLGENGSMLSGGQRQRIAIARALYRDPDILILDEATSALDTQTELIIQRAFDRFRDAGKTMLVIAHRLSTIAGADSIIVMKDGQIIEQGSHEQLLSMESAYKEMWKKQSVVLG